jgi:hypothetical protein
MSGWRDRLITAPLWFLFLYFAVAFSALNLILPHPGSGRSLAGTAMGGLAFAVGMTFLDGGASPP